MACTIKEFRVFGLRATPEDPLRRRCRPSVIQITCAAPEPRLNASARRVHALKLTAAPRLVGECRAHQILTADRPLRI